MKPSLLFRNEIFLLRPLLQYSRERIVSTSQHNNWKWWEDPSNTDPKYTRNFLRNTLESSDIQESEFNSLFESVQNLNQQLDNKIHSILARTTHFLWQHGAFILHRHAFYEFNHEPTVQLQAVKYAVKMICRNPTKLRETLCEEMMQFLQSPKQNKLFSIAGCLIYPTRDYFVFTHSTEDVPRIMLVPNNKVIEFDSHWKILCTYNGRLDTCAEFYLQYMTPALWKQTKRGRFGKLRNPRFLDLPPAILRSLIVITTKGGEIVAAPQVNMFTRALSGYNTKIVFTIN